MAIKLDISPNSVVVYCTDCGHWRAFAWSRDEGNDRAAAHEERVHPEQREARRRVEARDRAAAELLLSTLEQPVINA